jgi:Sporulation and spore germination/WD40-like Beta Propeller Repeat
VGSRPVRLLRPAAALAVLLGLTACTAGVPKSGEVVTVAPVTTTPATPDPETPQDLGGPYPGQSETDVAIGYMNAMNSGDLERIQRWVLPGVRNQVAAWDKESTTVQVYSVFEPGLPYTRGDGTQIVPVRVKMVGQLRLGRDWYPDTGDRTLNLEVGRDGADARIANPALVIWMRDVNFSGLYASTEVYMIPDLADPSPQVAPVPVFVPKGAEGDPEALERPVKRALELLLAGPRGRYRNLSTAIPRGTRLRRFRYARDVATVNLSRSFTLADGSGQLRVGQVVWTVNRLLPTASVRILVDGRAVRTVGEDRFPTTRRWRRRDMPLAAMWPRRSQERQDASILFVRRGEIYTVAPRAGQRPNLVALTGPPLKSAPTWSPDHRLMAFLAGSGRTQGLWVGQPDGRAHRAAGVSGRLSPPSWSPDSQRIYVVSRDEAGVQLIEVERNSLQARPLELPPPPRGLQLASVAVSPDGAFLLAVADDPGRPVEVAEPVPGGQLLLGQFGPDGVLDWSERPLAPGLGRVFSPVWVDPVTVAFIAETSNKDDLGKLWTIRSDGWDPTAVFNESDIPIGDIGNHLTVDPSGRAFVVTTRSTSGASLWMVDRQDKSVDYLTLPEPNAFDGDPSYASR